VLYLYYIINKDINDMSGVESRVYNAIYDVSTKTAKGTWLPVLHARSIEQCGVKRISGLVHEENRVDLKNEIHDATAVIRDAAIAATAVMRDVTIVDLKNEIHAATAVMRDVAIADLKAFIENVIRDAASSTIRDAATAVTRDAATAVTGDAATAVTHDAVTAVTRDAATTGRVTLPPLEG
jgi:hypothetical protein